MEATAVKAECIDEVVVEPLKILVAEDSDITSNLLRILLGQRGHAVTCVRDGKAALEALNETVFDVCLIDFHLPQMNGLDVVRQIRVSGEEGCPRTRFIGMTADVEGLLAHPSNCEILDMVFGKPIVAGEIFEAVETAGWPDQGAGFIPKSYGNVARFDARKAISAETAGPTVEPGHYVSQETGAVLPDRRRAPRKPASISGTTIRLANGVDYGCRIVSLSFLGCSIKSSCRPAIGESVLVGKTHARVVRVSGDDIALEFVRAA